MKQFLLSLCLLLFISAQAQQQIIRCYTQEVTDDFDKKNPGYIQRINQIFNEAKENIRPKNASRSTADTIFRIRTVFHVVYTNATDSIPESWIQSQIEVLNEDYRRKNADTTNTRSVFMPVAGDAKIEFVLASEDPDGNPTNGITYHQGTPPPFLGFSALNDEVKSYASGGRDPWPTDRYLNIWVCSIYNGLLGVLGYAFPPSNAPNWPANLKTDSAHQGVVLHYPVVGRLNPSPLDVTVGKGRSAVHEVGHYLGLRHIWGDTTGCLNDDGIDDTPKSSDASQQTCNLNANTCVDAPVDHPDMIENYMDYSDDRCLNMFTQQQIEIMRYILRTSRSGIVAETIIEFPASVNELAGSLNVKVFPNPTAGNISISVNQDSGSDNVQYFLSDITGREVLKGDINQTANIDIAQLHNGVYVLKLKSARGEKTEKIYLQK